MKRNARLSVWDCSLHPETAWSFLAFVGGCGKYAAKEQRVKVASNGFEITQAVDMFAFGNMMIDRCPVKGSGQALWGASGVEWECPAGADVFLLTISMDTLSS